MDSSSPKIWLCTTEINLTALNTTKIFSLQAWILQLSRIEAMQKSDYKVNYLISSRLTKTKQLCADIWMLTMLKTSWAINQLWLELPTTKWNAWLRELKIVGLPDCRFHPMALTGKILIRQFKYSKVHLLERFGQLTLSQEILWISHWSLVEKILYVRGTATRLKSDLETRLETRYSCQPRFSKMVHWPVKFHLTHPQKYYTLILVSMDKSTQTTCSNSDIWTLIF